MTIGDFRDNFKRRILRPSWQKPHQSCAPFETVTRIHLENVDNDLEERWMRREMDEVFNLSTKEVTNFEQ